MTFWWSDELLIDDEDNLELYFTTLETERPTPKSDDGELLVDAENDRIFSYNIRTRQLRLGPIYYSGPYVKSLVSVKGKTGL